MIPEPQHMNSSLSKKGCSHVIIGFTFISVMLATIEFNR